MPASKIFVSYSRKDEKFANKLEKRLQTDGFAITRDVRDLKAGRTETQLKSLIADTDALLLIFSESSAGSDWVEWEVNLARQREKAEKIDLLCPISLDDAWRSATWSGPLMLQVRDYNVLDFSKSRGFEEELKKLTEGLKLYYGTPVAPTIAP